MPPPVARLLSFVLILATPVPLAAAPASPWTDAGEVAVRLVAAAEAVGTAPTVRLGLHFGLGEGWKIYWRSPGDAGFPPSVNWDGSINLAGTTVAWPAPTRFSILGFETLGYHDEVVLPVTATLIEPGRPLAVRAAVEYLACKDICIPRQASLALDLPAGPARPGPFAHLIDRYQARVPGIGGAQGIAIGPLTAAGRTLTVTARASSAFTAPDLFVEGPPGLAFAPPRVEVTDGGRVAVMRVDVDGLAGEDDGLAGVPLTVTVVDGDRAAEASMTPVAAAAAAAVPEPAIDRPTTGLAAILVLAVLGGVILNLMPCVLPVLSIKILGAVGHGGGEARAVRLSFLASAAGILASFAVLAAALVGLKAGGAVVGWGIQFQQPWFLVAMTLVVTAFACNLWGLFEVHLPHAVADVGEHASHVQGLGGHFVSGMLATVLATPCSAPFLGTAVGFALARGAIEIFAVFGALGVGLALPYLVVAAVPRLATRLPRPGRWMVRLKQILGLALAGTAAWLASVLGGQIGPAAAMAVAGLAAALAAVLYVRRHAPRLRRVAVGAGVVLAVAAFLVPALAPRPDALAAPTDSAWQPFDEAAIARLVAGGRTVFVDVTADWCITCQVNKRVTLGSDAVRRRLADPDVVMMQADWTRPDDAIAAYLASFGRYGIPFDAVYGPRAPQGLALPELLSETAVLAALAAAR